MTSREFIQEEAGNEDRIVLYREGLFWKAYERSAYAVCTQIRPFKPTKRSLKTLDGGALVSIGFPCSTENRVLDGLTCLETGADRLVLSARRPIAVGEFEAWKASAARSAAAENGCRRVSGISSACMYDCLRGRDGRRMRRCSCRAGTKNSYRTSGCDCADELRFHALDGYYGG